jgi:succinyl-CoA synthetase alpha subunit
MSILVNKNTKVICQGFTGKQATFHSIQALEYGTKLLGGVTPNKGGEIHLGLPVFNTVKDAVKKTKANTSVIYVPAKYASDSIIEAIDNGIELIICITEGIPILDMLEVKNYLKKSTSKLIGPNCPGIITPEECKIGIMPYFIHKKGGVGVISRSGTLTYEAVLQLTNLGLGQSTCIGIGGDPIKGLNFVEVLEMFWQDENTKAVVMIGEIGGIDEQEAADFINHQNKNGRYKPVLAFISGISAPKDKKMGHAGAIVGSKQESALEKIEYLKKMGVKVAKSPTSIGDDLMQII